MDKQNTDKLYYTIGEVASMFDVNVSLIRYWENQFSILKPKKNKKGNYQKSESISLRRLLGGIGKKIGEESNFWIYFCWLHVIV